MSSDNLMCLFSNVGGSTLL